MDIALNLDQATQGLPQHNDLLIGPTGDLVLTDGVEAIKQAVAQALKQFSQDWFLDLNVGLPYKQQLFGAKDLSTNFEAVMQNRVLQVPGILGLLSWSSSLDRRTRALSVSFDARCTGGVVQWSFNVNAL